MKVKLLKKVRVQLHLVSQVGILLNQSTKLVLQPLNLTKRILEIALRAVGRGAN